MKKISWLLLAALVVILGLLTRFGAIPPAIYAGTNDGNGPYTATVKYYDNVQITYELIYPNGGIWSGAGDIPIGGMSGGSSQIYCIDPFVAFHSIADSGWTDTTTDTMIGYTAAAPWAVSGAMRQNYDAVRWIVYNGYRGGYLANDAISQASVTRLQGYIGDTNVDKTVALMATKIAIWKVLVGDSIEIKRTSLDGNPAKRAALDNLIDALIANAKNPPGGSEGWTSFDIKINDAALTPLDTTTGAPGFCYYGPLTVTAELNNPAGIPNVDKVFLSVSGPESGGVSFVYDKTDPSSDLLEGVELYGTADISLQYLDGAGFEIISGVYTSEEFYLKIPADRLDETGYIENIGDMLNIKAMAMAKAVSLEPGTPVSFVYDKGGVQDWDFVQAYIGAANDGMYENLYAEAQLNTKATTLGEIYVSKIVENASLLDNDDEFTFALYYAGASVITPELGDGDRVNLRSHPVYGASSVDYDENTFTLKNGGMAVIEGLPVGPSHSYQVEEVDMPTGYSVLSNTVYVDSADFPTTVTSDITDPFCLEDDDFSYALVEFVNINTVTASRLVDYAHLYIGKVAIELTADGEIDNHLAEKYNFIIEYLATEPNGWAPVDLTDIFFSDSGEVTDAEEGEFTLGSTDMALIELDPQHTYRVTEFAVDQGFTPAYSLVYMVDDGGIWKMGFISTNVTDPNWQTNSEDPHISDDFNLEAGGEYFLVFSNTKIDTVALTIDKTVAGNVSAGDKDRDYWFSVIYTDNVLGTTVPWPTPWPVPLSTDDKATDAMYISRIGEDQIDPDNPERFSLKDGQSATIHGLPAGKYIVREERVSGFNVRYSVDEGPSKSAQGGETDILNIRKDTIVSFTNTKPYPSTEDETETPKQTGETETKKESDDDDDDDDDDDSDTKGGRDEQPEESISRSLISGGEDGDNKPILTTPGHTLIANGPGSYIELDEEGTPLGEWHWDEDLELWVFDEYVPLGNLPGTGDYRAHNFWVYLIGFSCVAFMFLFGFGHYLERKSANKRSRDS